METVYKHLGGSRMMQDMLEQEDLTRSFMALLHHLCDTCNRKGVGLESVSFGTPHMEGRTIKSKVYFGVAGHATGSIISGAVEKYFIQKHARCSAALKKNPRIEEFWKKVLTVAGQYAIHKHGSAKFLKVEKSIITPEQVINITLKA